MTAASIARVLVDSPLPQLDRLFDYRIPPELAADANPGVRVRVPLRSAGRVADGFIIEITESGDYSGPLSDIDAVVSSAPVLTDDVYRLARRLADRAAGSASDVIRLAVPKRQARVEKAWIAQKQADHDGDSGETPDLPDAPVALAPSIAGYESGTINEAIVNGRRLAISAIPRTVKITHVVDEEHGNPAAERWVGEWALTMAQAALVAIRAGTSAILVVPDYRDQDQLESALMSLLPRERIARLDARQSNPERYREFLRCLDGKPVVAIGNRSAVYAPVADVGLIALWDDGDPLHAEPLAPYVHSRDAALLRQEDSGCALAFFAHSRSTEVERLVELGWLDSVTPTPAIVPRIIATSLQSGDDSPAAHARIPSTAWSIAREAVTEGPVLVQVARPGYAPRLACAQCGETARCQSCEGPLGTANSRSAPSCQWCGAIAASWACAHCSATRIRAVGSGSTRTAEELGRAFPGVRIIVADGEHQITHVDSRPALVIATRGAEPIADGGYRAALLLDGERMLARESLRVAEDCVRWWSNASALVASRCPVVIVGVDGEVARALTTWRHADFARAELADRRSLRFPPTVRVATLTGTPDLVAATARTVGVPASDVLGPVQTDGGLVRTIIRFDYGRGHDVAAAIRAELVKAAAGRRRGPRGSTIGAPVLRARFDDVEPFESL